MFDKNIGIFLSKRDPEQKMRWKILFPKTPHCKTDPEKYEDNGNEIRPDQERFPHKPDTYQYQDDSNEEHDPVASL
jgi:hypothetical protein